MATKPRPKKPSRAWQRARRKEQLIAERKRIRKMLLKGLLWKLTGGLYPL